MHWGPMLSSWKTESRHGGLETLTAKKSRWYFVFTHEDFLWQEITSVPTGLDGFVVKFLDQVLSPLFPGGFFISRTGRDLRPNRLRLGVPLTTLFPKIKIGHPIEVRMFPVDSKILIVDDSQFARKTLKDSLKILKYWKILEAGDAKSAQSLLMEDEQVKDPVHLIISDLHMPEMDGIELLKWVRGEERIKAMPVIILTTVQEKAGILEAGKLGVSHYMIKPYDLATLKERMISTWDKHGQKYFESHKRT
jgi:two-component system chemotaxis response regulator CheY